MGNTFADSFEAALSLRCGTQENDQNSPSKKEEPVNIMKSSSAAIHV